MSAYKRQFHEHLVDCMECGHEVPYAFVECPHCDAPTRMVEQVNRVLKRAHERRDEYPPIRPVLIRKGA